MRITLNDKSVKRQLPEAGQVELWDALTPGFGLRISYKGARTYFVMRRVNGKLVRRTVGPAHVDGPKGPKQLSLREARAAAEGLLEKLRNGIDPKMDKERQRAEEASRAAALEEAARQLAIRAERTFKAVAERYLADSGDGGGANLKGLGELRRKFVVELYPAWGERYIDEITRSDIRELLAAKAKVARVSANRLGALVSRVFSWALDQEIIQASPAAKIKKPGGKERRRARVLSLDEIKRVWLACDALGAPFGPVIQFAILTAQRRGECSGLVWSEIQGADWHLPDERAKRGEGHTVPLSPAAMRLLGSAPHFERERLVFTSGRRGDSPLAGWSRAKVNVDAIIGASVARDAGEDFVPQRHNLPKWTIHDLRRSVATHLQRGGVEDRVISRILNHAQGDQTSTYARYGFDPERRAALEEWAGRVEALVGLNVMSLAAEGGAA